MNYSEIKKCSIENGPGVRVSLFVSGCRRHCPGCQNECAWDFNYGTKWSVGAAESLLNAIKPKHIQGLTILGGEPMEPENAQTVMAICRVVKEAYPEKDIWIYSGYVYETIIQKYPDLWMYADVLVDGPWVESLANLSLRFRGSSNQRIIDLEKSHYAKQIMFWNNAIDTDPMYNMKDYKPF